MRGQITMEETLDLGFSQPADEEIEDPGAEAASGEAKESDEE